MCVHCAIIIAVMEAVFDDEFAKEFRMTKEEFDTSVDLEGF